MKETLCGAKFGLLTIMGSAPSHVTPRGAKIRCVWCRCSCGNEKIIMLQELKRKSAKKTISCGCYRAQQNRLRRPPVATIHGFSSRKGNHYLYDTWKSIKRRCFDEYDANYYLYGGRGITVYSDWINDPNAFVKYILLTIGERQNGLSLDRKNNNGNYEPGNLRWATKREQVLNRRPPSEWKRNAQRA